MRRVIAAVVASALIAGLFTAYPVSAVVQQVVNTVAISGITGLGTNVATFLAANLTVNGALKLNGSGTPSQAACADLSNGAAGCSAALASQSDQTTGTSTTTFVSPARQQFHNSAVKAWAIWAGANTGTNPPTAGYNVTSVQRTGTGSYVVTFTTNFANANYACSVTGTRSASVGSGTIGTQTAWATNAATVSTQSTAGVDTDPSSVTVICAGVQ